MDFSCTVARRFSVADQSAFAAVSGDRNPIHVDELAARRLLYGAVVVHGIHLVLWALDCIVRTRFEISAFAQIKVNFNAPARVDEELVLSWQGNDGDLVRAQIACKGDRVARLSFLPQAASDLDWRGRRELPACACLDLDATDIAAREGVVELALPDLWRDLFPHLANRFSASQVAVLLATTRMIGMSCPGLHSILSGFKLNFGLGFESATTIDFFVRRFDPRFRIADIEITAPGVTGTVASFFRPKPYEQKRLTELAANIAPGEFAGQNALVVGGSRGLGALAAKLLAAGGAQVTITYARGVAEAASIVKEACAAGYTIAMVRYDILSDNEFCSVPEMPFSHIYYFATPRIPSNRPGAFDARQFQHLLAYYVSGFARAIEHVRPHATADACFWYPSSVFVEQDAASFPEYVAAKACGETFCARLAGWLSPLRFAVDRLPRLATDQTQALSEETAPDGVDTMLAVIRRLGHSPPQP